jgi:nitroimidazol reductase NimA-like FMN-containing flavoprotein (pyridoxamine 5'-phosphate oxidase superfamily)
MQQDSTEPAALSRAECLGLLATARIGRISYTRQALPAVQAVSFALHDEAIVFGTDADGELAAAVRQAVVAFQADDFDPVLRSGWSVTAVGRCDEVTDAGDLARLATAGLGPWIPVARPRFIRVVPAIVTGQRLRSR